jgi:hypothetical protein
MLILTMLLVLPFRLRSGPFEGPSTVKPPALPEAGVWPFQQALNAIKPRKEQQMAVMELISPAS